MEFSIEVPVDADGFIRRECPHCEQEFKWFQGETEETPAGWEDPDYYFCPYCGERAGSGEWWTKDQLSYAKQVAMNRVEQVVEDELGDMARTINRAGGLIRMEIPGGSEAPPPPPPLCEPNDMIAVSSPCHPFEPIKVFDGYEGVLHCLICGEPFSL